MINPNEPIAGDSRDYLRTALMQAPVAICILSGPDHTFTLANATFERLVGSRDLAGKSIRDAFPELEGQGIYELLDRVFATGEPFLGSETAVQYPREDSGEPITGYYNFVYQPMRADDGSVTDIFVQFTDVTEQVVAQRSLQAILEQMPMGVVIADAPAGRITRVNPQVEQILRHPALPSDDIAGYRAWGGVRPDGTPLPAEAWPLARAITTGEVTRGEEVRYLRGDGTMGWISLNAAPIRDADGRIFSGVVAFTDVTERRELLDAEQVARKQAEESADRLKRLLAVTAALDRAASREEVGESTLKLAMTTIGAIAGTIITRSEGGTFQLLARRGDGTGLPTSDEPGPAAETFRSSQPVWQPAPKPSDGSRRGGALITVPLVARSDVIGVMSLRLSSAASPGGDDLDLLVGITAQAAQALERARLFDAERAARHAAEDAVRSRDEFLSIASHELKTPIAAVKASAQLLGRRIERGDVAPERLMRACRIIDETADRLSQLTSELLDVSRLRAGNLTLQTEQLNLSDLVTDAVERYAAVSEQHSIELQIDTDPSFMSGDSVRIDQILNNLLNNAVKYSPSGGRIMVRLETEGGGYLVTVRDEGIGIPPAAIDAIFQPFGRATNAVANSFPGMGLGLHIAHNIVLQHRGRMWAESAGEGLGTTIRVWFPADNDHRASRGR